MVWCKDCKLVDMMHAIRDEMVNTSEDGRAACDLKSFGDVCQPLDGHALELLHTYPEEWSIEFQEDFDINIFPRLMCMSAKASLMTFLSQLEIVCPHGDARFNILVGPVKLPARIGVKVHEYADEHDGKWPYISKVGDVLRVTIVCVDGDALFAAVQRVIQVFDLCDGNGRLKNMLGTKKHMPPRLLLNVVVRAQHCPPIMVRTAHGS